jgi:hypothetical protein
MGGDFALSGRLAERYLERNDWDTDTARYSAGLWLTTIAVAEGRRVCQSFLGARAADKSAPAAGLAAMLEQVAGSLFTLMEEYRPVWDKTEGSRAADVFGQPTEARLDPAPVDVEGMVETFRRGCEDFEEIWTPALDPDTLAGIRALAVQPQGTFHMPDGLWARVLIDLACSHHRGAVGRRHLLRSLAPLYLARLASFVHESRDMVSWEVEQRIEDLCLELERNKPLLVARWEADAAPSTAREPQPDHSRTDFSLSAQ